MPLPSPNPTISCFVVSVVSGNDTVGDMAGEEKSSVFYFVPNASKGMQSAKLCSYKIFPFFNWGCHLMQIFLLSCIMAVKWWQQQQQQPLVVVVVNSNADGDSECGLSG